MLSKNRKWLLLAAATIVVGAVVGWFYIWPMYQPMVYVCPCDLCK